MRQNTPALTDSCNKQSLHRILVVNDQRHIARLFEVNLERAGYDVVIALDGSSAVERIMAELPDLIIIDADMPQMDGYVVLEQICAMPNRKSLRIMMLVRSEAEGQKSLDAGSDFYMIYPFDPYAFCAFLRRD
jgi:two-component system alkaline phosphatase synthesis response regulator PhoP